jgi:hypothetical protein
MSAQLVMPTRGAVIGSLTARTFANRLKENDRVSPVFFAHRSRTLNLAGPWFERFPACAPTTRVLRTFCAGVESL